MAAFDKDAVQKEKAIRYCISNGILPYLEVIVNNVREITDVKTIITDLDVLGIEVSRRGSVIKTLFDCKTVGKMSAINRAFWAAGVMAFTGCDEAYVILSKKASEAHRVSAKSLKVHLFQEQDFDSYAQSASIDYLDLFSYASKIDNWHLLYKAFDKNSNLKSLGEYINSKLPLEKDNAKALRELIGVIRANKGEIDPAKPEHMAIYFSLILSFLLVMGPVSSQMSDVYDQDMTQAEYEKSLRYYIWGGRESYIQRRDLKNAVLDISGAKKGELELPGWADFVQVSRGFLDAHSELRAALIPCRELSLRCISIVDKEIDKHLHNRINSSNRTRQFMIASSSYIYKATGLPKDFHENLKNTISSIDESIRE
ncbi:hypothetical protein [Aeromonas salmonicida]